MLFGIALYAISTFSCTRKLVPTVVHLDNASLLEVENNQSKAAWYKTAGSRHAVHHPEGGMHDGIGLLNDFAPSLIEGVDIELVEHGELRLHLPDPVAIHDGDCFQHAAGGFEAEAGHCGKHFRTMRRCEQTNGAAFVNEIDSIESRIVRIVRHTLSLYPIDLVDPFIKYHETLALSQRERSRHHGRATQIQTRSRA